MRKLTLGGNTKPKKGGSRIPRPPRSALIVYPRRGNHKAEIIQITSTDDLVNQLGLVYKVKLRNSSGKIETETIVIKEHDDFDLDSIVAKSRILSKLRWKKELMQSFIEEWSGDDTSFQSEIGELIANEVRRKQALIQLRLLKKALKDGSQRSDLLQCVQTISQNQ
ncbi:MAG: hypothetical protein AAF433_00190 [Bacteroidota bacterium]